MPESEAPVITPESTPDVPPPVPEAPTPVPRDVPMLEATYHVALWTEPEPTYVCLLCTVVDLDHAGILEHLTTVHATEAIPSPLTADYLAQNPVLMAMVSPEGGQTMGEPHGKPDETPGGRPETPPGQEGEQPGNRPDVPPGQPHPEHPIEESDEDAEKA